MTTEVEQLLEQRKKILAGEYVGNQEKSVLDNNPTSAKDVIVNTLESVGKGSAKGILDLVGGWEALYNYLKSNGDSNAFKPTGILNGVKKLTGINLESAPYATPYNFAAAAAPAAALSSAGLPGMFSISPESTLAARAATAGKEGLVAGTTGTVANLVAPDSPFAQTALQLTPFAGKGLFNATRNQIMKPVGSYPDVPTTENLLNVGPMTPGQLSGNRVQLATENKILNNPKAESALPFKQAQASNVKDYLDNLFNKSAEGAMSPEQTTKVVVDSFNNYGKALSSQLRSDAAKDFGAARASGGTVSTQPVVDAVNNALSKISPETPGFEGLKGSLNKIINEYSIPEVPATKTPSTIMGPDGQPAAVTVNPGTPAQAINIDIGRLQKNLSAWGEAAYSGKADFGKGNIFEGVAPGQVKGIAFDVLKGFRTALDEAIDNGVAGADKLKIARDRFSANLDKIAEYSDRPLTKAFDVASVSELVPEKVVLQLKTMPESQRQILVNVMANNPQASNVLDTIRKSTFDEVLNKAKANGAAENAPMFNIDVALKALDSKSGDFAFLFPSQSARVQAETAVNYMRKVLQSEVGGGGQGVAGSTSYAMVKAAGGNTQQANAMKELTDSFKMIIANPKVFSEVLFDPNSKQALLDLAKGKTTVEKIKDFLTSSANTAGVTALRAGPMLSTETAPANSTGGEQPNIDNMSVEELLKLRNQLQQQ